MRSVFVYHLCLNYYLIRTTQTISRKKRIVIAFAVVFLTALAFLYYVIFPIWVKNQIHDLTSDPNEPLNISVENIHATAWPIGLHLKNVSIQKVTSDSTTTDSLFIGKIIFQRFNLFSFLLHKNYNIGNITLDHFTGRWTLPADDTSKLKAVFPFHLSCQTLSFKDVSLALKKRNSSRETTLENGNVRLKNVVVEKDSLLTSITYHIAELNLAVVKQVSSDSLYTFRGDHIIYSDKDSIMYVDSFFSVPNVEKYAFAQMHPFQTDRVFAAFKNISFRQTDVNAFVSTGDLQLSSIHIDTFLLDIFRDRRRPFLHKKRPLFQDLLFAYPGVLSIDSIIAHNGKIIYTEHDEDATKPGIIWFSDVTARLLHLYNDTATLASPNDTFIVAAQALAMDKGKIEFESKGLISDQQNTFVFNGHMENIPAAAFNPILIPNATIKALDGYVQGIYFNFSADKSLAKGDLIFRYRDLSLLKVDDETKAATGLKNRLLTQILKRKIIDDNPLPNDTLRTGTIYFERDPEKMYFSYMLKSIFSGIKETVMK